MIRLTLFIVTASIALAASAGAAHAQTFSYGKAEEVKDVKEAKWTATAEGGLVLTTGNSRTTTVSGAAHATRVDPKNKFDATASMAYVRSRIFVAQDDDPEGAEGHGTLSADEIHEQTATTANSWQVKLRYDRYLTEFNSLYATASVGADRPAGKDFVGGAQAGYSRRVYKDDKHEVVAEVGYDFTYENLAVGDGVSIHSARAFAGYKGIVTQTTALEASVEALSNLNTLDTVPDEAGPGEDTRINGMASVNTKITDDISLSVSFQAKFDNQPAPRPALAIPYDAGFIPVADKLDTITKASVIVSLF
jgi:hypothetical protein